MPSRCSCGAYRYHRPSIGTATKQSSVFLIHCRSWGSKVYQDQQHQTMLVSRNPLDRILDDAMRGSTRWEGAGGREWTGADGNWQNLNVVSLRIRFYCRACRKCQETVIRNQEGDKIKIKKFNFIFIYFLQSSVGFCPFHIPCKSTMLIDRVELKLKAAVAGSRSIPRRPF